MTTNGTGTAQQEAQATTEVALTPRRRSTGTLTRDPEFVAMAKIGALLESLETDGRSRVVRYIAEKYQSYLS